MNEGHTPDTPRGWYHRRIMAYAAWAGLVIIGVAALVMDIPPANLELLGTIAWVLGLIVISFYGGNAAEAVTRLRR